MDNNFGNFNENPNGNFNGNPNGNFNGNPNGNFNGNPNGNFNGNPNGNFNGNPNGNFNGNPNGNFNGNPWPNGNQWQNVRPYQEVWDNKKGIISMILGILSVTFFWMILPSLAFAIAALILGISQLNKNKRCGVHKQKGMAVLGIVLSLLTFLMIILLFVLIGIGTARNGDLIYREILNLNHSSELL